jgi:AraC family transcriptional regulator of adaptative response / methylphosphotriester-DNA alkyltransferase methyltransferase
MHDRQPGRTLCREPGVVGGVATFSLPMSPWPHGASGVRRRTRREFASHMPTPIDPSAIPRQPHAIATAATAAGASLDHAVPVPGPRQRERTSTERTSIVRDAAAIIEREYASRLRLEDVARRVATSRRQLQRSFAESPATSFQRHLTAVRMIRAAELLCGRGQSVRDIARQVGYRQPGYFAKAFREYHGVTPAAFRAANRTQAAAHRHDESCAAGAPECAPA